MRLNQKCVVPKSRRWHQHQQQLRGEQEEGGAGGGGDEKPAPLCLEAAVEGTLVALIESVQRPEDCAASMVLAFHRLLAEGRCDRGRSLRTL